MPRNESYVDVPVIYVQGPGTELEKFVSIFGQDFDLLFSGFDAAATAFCAGLDMTGRASLKSGLLALLDQAPDDGALRRAWVANGAQFVPPDLRASVQRLAGELS